MMIYYFRRILKRLKKEDEKLREKDKKKRKKLKPKGTSGDKEDSGMDDSSPSEGKIIS